VPFVAEIVQKRHSSPVQRSHCQSRVSNSSKAYIHKQRRFTDEASTFFRFRSKARYDSEFVNQTHGFALIASADRHPFGIHLFDSNRDTLCIATRKPQRLEESISRKSSQNEASCRLIVDLLSRCSAPCGSAFRNASVG